MSNSLLNISMITKEALRVLKNELGMAKNVNRQYDDQFAKSGAKIGSVINIRKPVRYTVTDGASLDLQNVTDQSVALTLDKQKHVGFQFSSKEMALNIDDFSNRYIKPAVISLANQIDYDLASLYTKVWNTVGTIGTTPATLAVALAAGQKLDENGCPADGRRSLVLNPAGQAGMVGGLSTLFHSAAEIEKQYEKGRMGLAAGFKWYMDQNIRAHTTGKYFGDTVLVDDAGGTTLAAGTSLIHMDGFGNNTTGAVKAGDVFTIDNVYAINPQSRQSTGALMQFVVQADADSTGADADISFLPAIYASGPYQNVTALPVNDAGVTFLTIAADSKVSPVNLAFHEDAFCLGMADLPLPGGVDMAARATDPDAGLSVRIVRDYDINNDSMPCRIDVLYGVKDIYPQLACRIQG